MGTLTKDRGITAKGARAMFNASFITRRRRLIYPKFCQVRDSYVETDIARNIGTVPQLEEVIDDVNTPLLSDFPDYSQSWTNRLFKARLSISRSLMEFDQVGQTRTLIHSLAARLANFPDLLMITRLLSGTMTCYDDQNLISATHPAPQGGTVQSNWLNGTTPVNFCTNAPVETVARQLQTDFRNAITRMRSFRDDKNQPWHNDDIRPEDLIILCSPLLWKPFQQALMSKQIFATDNIYVGDVREVVASNYLPITGANAADWWLCHVGEMARPIQLSRFRRIRTEEIQDAFDPKTLSFEGEEVTVTPDDIAELASAMLETNMGHQGSNADADVIENDRFLMSARWRGEVFGGEWKNIVFVDNAIA